MLTELKIGPIMNLPCCQCSKVVENKQCYNTSGHGMRAQIQVQIIIIIIYVNNKYYNNNLIRIN